MPLRIHQNAISSKQIIFLGGKVEKKLDSPQTRPPADRTPRP